MTINVALTNVQWHALCSLVVERVKDQDPQRVHEWVMALDNGQTDLDELLTVLMEAEEQSRING